LSGFFVESALQYASLFAANPAFDISQDDSNTDKDSNIDHYVFQDAYSDDDISKAVLRCLESKVRNGWSQTETLSELRNVYCCVRMVRNQDGL